MTQLFGNQNYKNNNNNNNNNKQINRNKSTPLIPSSNEEGNISEKGQLEFSVRVCPLFELNEFVYCKCNLVNSL